MKHWIVVWAGQCSQWVERFSSQEAYERWYNKQRFSHVLIVSESDVSVEEKGDKHGE